MVEIDESVSVVAAFHGGRIRPVRFRWKGRLIPVRQITYQWTRKDGWRMIHFFSVTDGKTLYNLSFEPDILSWRLQAVETEGEI